LTGKTVRVKKIKQRILFIINQILRILFYYSVFLLIVKKIKKNYFTPIIKWIRAKHAGYLYQGVDVSIFREKPDCFYN